MVSTRDMKKIATISSADTVMVSTEGVFVYLSVGAQFSLVQG